MTTFDLGICRRWFDDQMISPLVPVVILLALTLAPRVRMLGDQVEIVEYAHC